MSSERVSQTTDRETMTKKEREQALSRCNAVPKGPWEARHESGDEWCVGDNNSPFGWGTYIDGKSKKLCKFIAHARTDLPRAIATIDCLENENKNLKKLIFDFRSLAKSVLELEPETLSDPLHEALSEMARVEEADND